MTPAELLHMIAEALADHPDRKFLLSQLTVAPGELLVFGSAQDRDLIVSVRYR